MIKDDYKHRKVLLPIERDALAFILSNGTVSLSKIIDFLQDGRKTPCRSYVVNVMCRLKVVLLNNTIDLIKEGETYRVARVHRNRAMLMVFGAAEDIGVQLPHVVFCPTDPSHIPKGVKRYKGRSSRSVGVLG